MGLRVSAHDAVVAPRACFAGACVSPSRVLQGDGTNMELVRRRHDRVSAFLVVPAS